MEWPLMIKPQTVALLVLGLAAGTLVTALYPHPPQLAEPLWPGVSGGDRRLSETRMLRCFAKALIADEVIGGRQPLLEAAALFGALNRLPPEPLPLSVADVEKSVWGIPSRTDEERLCRQVVAWVSHRMPRDQADAAVARLAAEYRWELHAQGAIRLPDPASLESPQELLARVRKGLREKERQNLFGNPRQGAS
jgi:hypothetical protein